MTQGEDTRKINFLFGFNQQNAGEKWPFLRIFQGNHQCPSSCPVGVQMYEEGTVKSCGRFF
jgi:hypothetical protein